MDSAKGRNTGRGGRRCVGQRVPCLLQPNKLSPEGTGREREGCCGQQHQGGLTLPTMLHALRSICNATQGYSATVGLLCSDAGLPCSEMRLPMLHALLDNINDAV